MLFSVRAQHLSTFPPISQSPIASAVMWLDQHGLSTLQTIVKLLMSCEDCCSYFGSIEQLVRPTICLPPHHLPPDIILFGPKNKLSRLTNRAHETQSTLPMAKWGAAKDESGRYSSVLPSKPAASLPSSASSHF